MASKCTDSQHHLVIGEVQIQTIRKYPFIHTRTAVVLLKRKQQVLGCGEIEILVDCW